MSGQPPSNGTPRLALTGPGAAALLGLDGFRNLAWPPLWCSPIGSRSGPGTIRTRRWLDPTDIDGVAVAHPSLVVRHIGLADEHAYAQPDGLCRVDRIELGVEHGLRAGLIQLRDLTMAGGRGTPELAMIRDWRGAEPPTESYAETRAVQLLRSAGWTPWRQVPVLAGGRIVHRADFVLPYHRRRRPELLRPHLGLLIEIDGRAFHADTFEKDHRRQTTYDLLGYHWTSFTPSQLEHEPARVCATVERLWRIGRARSR